MKKQLLKGTMLAALLLGLASCSGWNVPPAKPTAGRNPSLAEIPDADETVRGDTDPPIVTLDLGESLHEHKLNAGEELPGAIIVPTTNFRAVPVGAALQAVLTGTDVALSWDTGKLENRLVTVMNLSGPLPKVVDKICGAAKVFCTYRNGSLELSDKETFVVSLPPIAKTIGSGSTSSSGGTSGGGSNATGTNTMVETIDELIGKKVQVDEQGGNIIYTTDVDGDNRVKRYLEQLRNGRPLVVLQFYVWEVTLDKENASGINWSKFNVPNVGPPWAKLGLSATSAFTSLDQNSGSVSVGAVTTGKINTKSLFTFLSTQGRVQTISNPQVTFVSGSSAEMKVGGKQRYIAQVGQLVGTTNTTGTGSTPSSSLGSNTVSTDSIDTGLIINVAGSYENGVVFANLNLSLTNLVSLNPTASGGGTVDLPSTTDEKISTVIRVRPGDNLVMAGLVASKDENKRQGLPVGSETSVPTYGDDTLQNRELVVVVKPSIIQFSDKSAADKKKAAANKPLPNEAVLIDKDGSQPIKLPSMPVALTNEPSPTVVDQHLMQRGLSRALDEPKKGDAP